MTIDLGGVVLHLVHNINLVRRPQEQLQTSSVKPYTTNGATVRGRRGCAHLLGTNNTVSNDLELAERGLICAWLTGGVHGLGVGRSKERNCRRQGADVGPVRTIHNGAGQIKSGAVVRVPRRLSKGRVEGRGTGKGSNKIERGLYTPRRPLERDADREAARAGRSSMRRDWSNRDRIRMHCSRPSTFLATAGHGIWMARYRTARCEIDSFWHLSGAGHTTFPLTPPWPVTCGMRLPSARSASSAARGLHSSEIGRCACWTWRRRRCALNVERPVRAAPWKTRIWRSSFRSQ